MFHTCATNHPDLNPSLSPNTRKPGINICHSLSAAGERIYKSGKDLGKQVSSSIGRNALIGGVGLASLLAGNSVRGAKATEYLIGQSYVNGSGNLDVNAVNLVMDNLLPGDSVFIQPGEYIEHNEGNPPYIRVPSTVSGTDVNPIIIHGGTSDDTKLRRSDLTVIQPLIVVYGQNIHICDLTVDNSISVGIAYNGMNATKGRIDRVNTTNLSHTAFSLDHYTNNSPYDPLNPQPTLIVNEVYITGPTTNGVLLSGGGVVTTGSNFATIQNSTFSGIGGATEGVVIDLTALDTNSLVDCPYLFFGQGMNDGNVATDSPQGTFNDLFYYCYGNNFVSGDDNEEDLLLNGNFSNNKNTRNHLGEIDISLDKYVESKSVGIANPSYQALANSGLGERNIVDELFLNLYGRPLPDSSLWGMPRYAVGERGSGAKRPAGDFDGNWTINGVDLDAFRSPGMFTGPGPLDPPANINSLVFADIDSDGDIDCDDYGQMKEAYKKSKFADINKNCSVGAEDLALLLGAWGPYTFNNQEFHFADFNGNHTVGAEDLALLLGAWGQYADEISWDQCPQVQCLDN